MPNAEYWKKRFEVLEDETYKKSQKYIEDMEKQFREAQNNVSMDIERWYQRLADNNDISLAAARKLLEKNELEEFHWNVEKYIEIGERNAVNPVWMKELENASARVHIQRLEAMKLQMQQHAELLYTKYHNGITEHLRESYSDRFYRTAFEIQKGIAVGSNLSVLDTRKIDKVLTTPWATDEKNFSTRIWNNKGKLVNELHRELTQSLIRGDDPQKAINNLAKDLNTSKTNAGRLVMTETAAISSAAQNDCFKELDVEEFEIVATLDNHTSEICQHMDGQHFPLSQYEVGVTAPPFHVWCRSTTVPYFNDEFTEGEKRAARDAEGDTYYVPANMTYPEWKRRSVVKSDNEAYSNITKEWINNKNNKDHKFVELKSYEVDGHNYTVDNKHVLLDFSEKEKNIAMLLLEQFGGKIEMVPRIVYPPKKSTPDYLYNGEKYDLKEPIGESKNVLYNMVSKKKTQANNFIFDISNCPLEEYEIIEQINGLYKSRHTKFIDKIILINEEKLIGVYKRK